MLFIDSEIHAKCEYLPILQSVREITGRNVPVWNFWTSGAYTALCVFGPEKYGGLGDVANKAQDVAAATGRDVEEVTRKVGPLLPISLLVPETNNKLDDKHEAG